MLRPENTPKPTIQVIDDDERNCRLLNAILQAEGYTVLLAHNGIDGIAMAKMKQPDLVLLDLMMSAMDGFQVMHQLKDNALTRDIPVIVSSALDDEASLH